MWRQLLQDTKNGDIKALARCITLIENEVQGSDELLRELEARSDVRIVGITGPPGAGKSTLTDAIIEMMVHDGKRVAVLCVDPSSPFNRGALLGDRIRMSSWYTHPSVYIRSLATRGSLGGLHPMIVEITELLRAAAFDYIIIETVGVGQSEVEIAGLADATVLVVVPEGGDEIQTMKAGVMEIADIFVVNKSDRPEADIYLKNLRTMLAPAFSNRPDIPVLKTVASQKEGVPELYAQIKNVLDRGTENENKALLLAEKAYQLIAKKRLKDVSKAALQNEIALRMEKGNFSLYQFVAEYP